MKLKRNWALWNNALTFWLSFNVSEYGFKWGPFNWRVPFWGSVDVQPCGEMCAPLLLSVYSSGEECSCILYGFIFQPLEVKAHLSEWVWRQNLVPHGFRPGWGLQGWWDTGKTHPPRGDVCFSKARGRSSPCGCSTGWMEDKQEMSQSFIKVAKIVYMEVVSNRQLELRVVVWKCQATLYTTAETDRSRSPALFSYCC